MEGPGKTETRPAGDEHGSACLHREGFQPEAFPILSNGAFIGVNRTPFQGREVPRPRRILPHGTSGRIPHRRTVVSSGRPEFKRFGTSRRQRRYPLPRPSCFSAYKIPVWPALNVLSRWSLRLLQTYACTCGENQLRRWRKSQPARGSVTAATAIMGTKLSVRLPRLDPSR